MTLVWLTPLAFGLLAFIVGPILAHLIKRKPNLRIPFGAMMLIKKLPKELRRKRRLNDLLLLLIRILIISLFVIAATKPEIRTPHAFSDLSSVPAAVIVIDNSLSMNHQLGDAIEPDTVSFLF